MRKKLNHSSTRDVSTVPHASWENGDFEALDTFSDGFSVDDISMDTWVATHDSLDLVIPVFLSPQMMAQGTTTISYTRSTYGRPQGRCEREIVYKTIAWDVHATQRPVQVEYPDAGDMSPLGAGRLIVLIHQKTKG